MLKGNLSVYELFNTPTMIITRIGTAAITTVVLLMQSLQAAEMPQGTELKNNYRLGVEAISNLGVLSRAQQSYQLEKGGFAVRIDALDARISGKFYSYTIIEANKTQSIAKALPKAKGLKSFIAAVATNGQPADSNTYQFSQIICESNDPGFSVSNPKLDGMQWKCGQKSTKVKD
jgi:hypothetical protein